MAKSAPEKQPIWFREFATSQRANESKLMGSLNFLSDSVKDLQDEIKNIKLENKEIYEENATLRQENVKLKEELLEIKQNMEYLELQSRRNNLLITGIPEKTDGNERWKDTESLVIQNLSRCYGDIIQDRDIERAHRIA